MLKIISIHNFKCLSDENLELKPLVILTGPNSSGKSSLIQAILLVFSMYQQKNQPAIREVVKPFAQFDDFYNRYRNPSKVSIELSDGDRKYGMTCRKNSTPVISTKHKDTETGYEEQLFYLSANRIGPEEIVGMDTQIRSGHDGRYALGFFEQHKNVTVAEEFVKNEVSRTFKAQIAWWLSYILDTDLEVITQKITSTSARMSFGSPAISEISPFNVGAGNSYLLKILIIILAAKPEDIVIIENPEIHLHPKAQSRLGHLLAFVASRGVQLIIETHCEHLINRIRYEVYKKNISEKDVVIYYKNSELDPFDLIGINPGGHFIDSSGNHRSFPSGFFDSTLAELLEIS